MSSGTAVEDSCVTAFKELATRKVNTVLYRLSDDFSAIVPDSKGTMTYEDFVKALPENEPRYAIHDYEFATTDGRKTSKIVLFSWVPESSPIKHKMVYASSKSTLRATLSGIAVEIQATDPGDLDREEVDARVIL
ncbi:actin-binding ADF family protein [Streptomyces sp. NPDC099050]|uniref:actin-binding ADF family protein n=1 Tax=Streptomyces sp. NPDC099050 TaxID=3366100 RepID=UPI00382BCF7C